MCNHIPIFSFCEEWNKHLKETNKVLLEMGILIQVDENDRMNQMINFSSLRLTQRVVYNLSLDFLSVGEMRYEHEKYKSIFAGRVGILKEDSRIVAISESILFILDIKNVFYDKRSNLLFDAVPKYDVFHIIHAVDSKSKKEGFAAIPAQLSTKGNSMLNC